MVRRKSYLTIIDKNQINIFFLNCTNFFFKKNLHLKLKFFNDNKFFILRKKNFCRQFLNYLAFIFFFHQKWVKDYNFIKNLLIIDYKFKLFLYSGFIFFNKHINSTKLLFAHDILKKKFLRTFCGHPFYLMLTKNVNLIFFQFWKFNNFIFYFYKLLYLFNYRLVQSYELLVAFINKYMLLCASLFAIKFKILLEFYKFFLINFLKLNTYVIIIIY